MNAEYLVTLLDSFPNSIVVVTIAMLPVSELRGAVPIALAVYKMSPFEAYTFSVIGNIIPVLPLLVFLPAAERWLCRFSFFRRFFDIVFNRVRARLSDSIRKYGAIALIPFVATPLPVTGAWTGVAAAYIFNIKIVYAFPAIVTGILIAGVVVTLASLGIISIF